MSDVESEDLDAITTPPSLATTADPFTKEEVKQAGPPKLTPTDRLVESKDRHLADACRERDTLRERCDALNTELRNQLHAARKDFDAEMMAIRIRLNYEVITYRPECKRLREAFGWAVVFIVVGTVLVAAGGASISTAGYYPSLGAPLMWGGIGLSLSGVSVLVVTAIRGLITRNPGDRSAVDGSESLIEAITPGASIPSDRSSRSSAP